MLRRLDETSSDRNRIKLTQHDYSDNATLIMGRAGGQK